MATSLEKLQHETSKFSYQSILEIVLSKLKVELYIAENNPPPHCSQMGWINLSFLALSAKNSSTKAISPHQHAALCQLIFDASGQLIPHKDAQRLQWVRVLINQQMLYNDRDLNETLNTITRNHILASRCLSLKHTLKIDANYSLPDGLLVSTYLLKYITDGNVVDVWSLLDKLNGAVDIKSSIELIAEHAILKEDIRTELSKIKITPVDHLHQDTPLKKFLFYSDKSSFELTVFNYGLFLESIKSLLVEKIKKVCSETERQDFNRQFEKYIVEYIADQGVDILSDDILIEKYRERNIPNKGRSNTDGCFLLGKTLFLIEAKAIQENDFIKSTTDEEKVKRDFTQSLAKSVEQIINTAKILQENDIFEFDKIVGISITLEEFYLVSFANQISNIVDISFEIPACIKDKLKLDSIHIMSIGDFEKYFQDLDNSSPEKIENCYKLDPIVFSRLRLLLRLIKIELIRN